MLEIKVNDKFSYEINKNDGTLLINGKQTNADIRQINASCWHLINDLKSFNIEVISFNRDEKKAEIKVNNDIYTVSAKDQYDLLLDKLGLGDLNTPKISDIKAPMPGLVLKVFVQEGSAVKKDDNLFVLEAMKMENIIKAPADAVLKTVKIKPGDKVEKGQVLLLL